MILCYKCNGRYCDSYSDEVLILFNWMYYVEQEGVFFPPRARPTGEHENAGTLRLSKKALKRRAQEQAARSSSNFEDNSVDAASASASTETIYGISTDHPV